MTWLYRAAVVCLLAVCTFKLYDLERRTPSTWVLESQLRELITAVERLRR